MNWIIGIAILVIVGYMLDREIYFYEGVHLGPRVQAWLYDRWSRKYDEGKRESQLRDDVILAGPLLDAMKGIPEPFILDFATGTGRLSYALTNRPEFNGHIIALDLSQGMLEQAAGKLSRAERSESTGERRRSANEQVVDDINPPAGNVEFLRHQTLPLPFSDASFDVVCALEVLELFPGMDEPLAELARVLRPGGILLTSRGTEESGRKAKVKSRHDFGLLLIDHGFENIQISPWWKLFDCVIGVKNGRSEPVADHSLQDILKCSACGQIQWKRKTYSLQCGNCGRELTITRQGIVLN